MIACALCRCAALLLMGEVIMAMRHSHSVRRLQSLPPQGVVLRLPDPLDPGSIVYIPSDENSFGVLNYDAERALIAQYKSVLDDIIRWYLFEPDRIGCQRFHAMRICRPSRDGSYTSISSQTQYICTQDELMLYAEAHVRGEEHAGIEAMEDWTRIYAVFLQHLGMTQLAADVRASLPSPVAPLPALRPMLTSPTVDDPSTNPNHGPGQSALQKRTSVAGLLEVTTGTLIALVCAACTCGAVSFVCISRCRRTRGRRYQKLELQDLDQLNEDDPSDKTISGEQILPASATDILRAYAKSKQPREQRNEQKTTPSTCCQ